METLYKWAGYLFAGWCVLALASAAGVYGAEGTGETSPAWAAARSAGCFAWPLSLLYLRRDRTRYLRRLMSGASPVTLTANAPLPPVFTDAGESAPSAGTLPTLQCHAADDHLDEAEPLRRARDSVVHWAWLAFKADARVAAAYMAGVLPPLLGWGSGPDPATAQLLAVVGVIAGLANLGMAWLRWRRRPRFSMSDRALGASVYSTGSDLMLLLRLIGLPVVGPAVAGLWSVWLLASAATLPQWRVWTGTLLASLVLLISILTTAYDGVSATSVIMLLAVCVHLASLAWLDRRAQANGGPSLLVLRLFDADASTGFLFGRLLRVWGWFGNWFTVADRALLDYQNRATSNQTFYAVAGTFLASVAIVASTAIPAWAGSLRQLPAGLNSHMVVLGAIALGIFVHLQSQRLLLRSRCIASSAMLDHVLARLGRRPRHLDFLHKGVYLPCYDDTWKPSVATLVARSAAVLMDVRGYDPSRNGCRYEIHYLADHVPLHRVVFLIQSARDAEVVAESVAEALRTLRAESPNQSGRGGSIQAFYLGAQGDEDIAALTALLLRAAEAAPQAQARSAST